MNRPTRPPGSRERRQRAASDRQPRGPRPVVAIFAKAPEPGHVKTRLTPVLRAREAAELYEAMLLDTLDVAESCGETVVAYAPASGRRPLERLLGPRRWLVPQGPGDLGARLTRVFERLCDGRRPVLAVGSDCPGLTRERLMEAARRLSRADVALGPALDGGYYLIGLRRPARELFRDIPWSTAGVMEATRHRAEEVGLRIAELEPSRDLDTPEDLYEWYVGARAAELARAYPRTWHLLHAILPPRRFAALEEAIAGRLGR